MLYNNKHTKHIFITIILSVYLIFSIFFILPKNSFSYQQTESTCYSQCLAYKFVWQGTYCYDVFADNCTEENGNTIKKTIMFLKSIYDVVKSGDNIDIPFKALFVCKPLIESCIVPAQQDCTQTCVIDKNVYAPDLSVGHPESSFQGVYYDKNSKQLYFKLVNNGMGYAWDIDVEAKAEVTQKRDNTIEVTKRLFKEKVEHLIYLGARNGPPKSFSDAVTDFLINEAENGKYLKDFKKWLLDDQKSDANNYNVPNYWIKAIPYQPLDGWLNRITFKVDPNQLIPEVWEQNNTFVLDIDLRPTPARFTILDGNIQQLVDQTLNSFNIHFVVKNTGEENGYASAKIFEGKYQDGKTPIYQNAKPIPGKSYLSWDTTITFDQNKESKPYCGNSKEYTLVIFDDEGNKTEKSFSLPMYIGSVNGRVEDLFGKKVVGATIKASTSEETIVNSMGYYHLEGITTPGKITITASHPEFSLSDSKELEFKFVNEFDACKEGNLLFNSVNFVLKDQDVMFTVTVKDSSGNPVTAQVLANNAASWRFNETVNGTGPLPGMQPGKYLFTISAAGYKTISQDVNAIPNDQNLEFVLEKLQGRLNDDGLHVITPRLLWEKTLGQGERIVSNMSGSKNGNLLVAYTLDNKAKNSNLYFLDLVSGSQLKETSVPYALGYEGDVGLDISYDGGTVGLNTYLGIKKDNERIMKVFDSSGSEFGSTTLSKGQSGWVTSMDVSPDGFYLCPGALFNKGLYKYTRYEIEGGDYDYGRPHSADCGKHFLRNNNIVTPCKGKQEGYCEETLAKQQVRVIGDTDEGESIASTIFDSANNQTVVVRTYKKLYYLGGSSWKKEVESDNMYKSVAVSPGGKYTIVTEGSGAYLKLKIFENTGGDKTPDFPYKNVKFVFANDKGLFFAQVVLNKIEFYQIGEYENEYHPDTISPTVVPERTNDISFYRDGQFYPYGQQILFHNLDGGRIYKADKNIKVSIIDPHTNTDLGTLSITKDTLFSIDNNKHPVLLKGQMTANFGSPTTVFAIKFDRFDMGLFQTKLNQFITGSLPADEYFIVQNIHTKFTVINELNNTNIAVEKGQVNVTANKTIKTINSGKQITIDEKNNIKESIYINSKIYPIIIGALFLIGSIILFKYRKTKVGAKIISILRISVILFWKYVKLCIKWFWKTIKIIMPILWKGIKKGCQNLIKLIKNTSKKKDKA